MIDVAVGVGFVALVLIGVGIKLIATRPKEPLVRRPVRIVVGAVGIVAGGFLAWLTVFFLSTPLI
jgi:hypothetical protein